MTAKRPQRPTALVLSFLSGLLVAGAYHMDRVPVQAEAELPLDESAFTVTEIDDREAQQERPEHSTPLIEIGSTEAGVIAGTVVDAETGRPVESAQMVLLESDIRGVTNNQGRFLLLNVPPPNNTQHIYTTHLHNN